MRLTAAVKLDWYWLSRTTYTTFMMGLPRGSSGTTRRLSELVAVKPPIMGPADTDVLVGSVTTMESVVADDDADDRRPSLCLLTNVDVEEDCCSRMLDVDVEATRDDPEWGCHLLRSEKGRSTTR